MSIKNVSKIDVYLFIVAALGRNPAAHAGIVALVVVVVVVVVVAVAVAVMIYYRKCQETTEG